MEFFRARCIPEVHRYLPGFDPKGEYHFSNDVAEFSGLRIPRVVLSIRPDNGGAYLPNVKEVPTVAYFEVPGKYKSSFGRGILVSLQSGSGHSVDFGIQREEAAKLLNEARMHGLLVQTDVASMLDEPKNEFPLAKRE